MTRQPDPETGVTLIGCAIGLLWVIALVLLWVFLSNWTPVT